MEKQCTNQPFLVLMQTSKAIQERIGEEMNKNKLGITEFSVLEVLYHKGRQTIHQIGKSILISSGSMTYVIDKLEKKGLLSRSPCPDDRRVIFVALTDAGIDLMKKVMPKHQEMINNMFGSLTDEDAQTMVSLLKKVNK
ncbi:MarR family transcriptional regulator [Bacillus sp. EB600]|uniref:MarR family winged helix-turn-helix transcriptional regulator n=1 Tax=Bacillus sp. EB600 TaxID=2806345 RepID=UPI00210ACBF1|nr:MarR family transcriptional regulator [Bacillus sp. EB600]MCQ6279499.1 MarR family transcriptional regulator [Bacillus sp. EB600]